MPLEVGALLPGTAVRDMRTGRDKRVPWRPDGVSVLVLPHDRCDDCAAFLARLDEDTERFTTWGARLRAVTSDENHATRLTGRIAFDVLLDANRRLHRALRVSEDRAALVVLDVHGQVFCSADLDAHDFPPIDELLDEARFPALQCPECETPDVPGRTLL